MPLKIYRPVTAGLRKTSVIRGEVSRKEPEKFLVVIKKQKAGRDNRGKISVRHRGGGAKQFYRLVDFKRDKFDIPAKVLAIEYDPNRSAYLALLQYQDGKKCYIIAPGDLKVGEEVISSSAKVGIKPGNAMPLEFIPTGVFIYNLEIRPGQGGKIARGAGNQAMVMSLEGQDAIVKLPSGEIRKFNKKCLATIGQVSNLDWRNIRWGKAGRMRHRGIRPTVRGKAMNPPDHPHGGGEGRNPIGLVHPKTPWGKPALGVKTRKKKKWSDKFIIKRKNNR